MHSVKDYIQLAFEHVGLDWEKYVIIDEKFFRPAEIHHLLGDATLAKKTLGWQPKTSFESLVKMMVDHDLTRQR